MEQFTKEELRWIIKMTKKEASRAVGVPLLCKIFEVERKAKKLIKPNKD